MMLVSLPAVARAMRSYRKRISSLHWTRAIEIYGVLPGIDSDRVIPRCLGFARDGSRCGLARGHDGGCL